MMHATSESDVASIAPSPSSPMAAAAAYFVQSPSRDSHDETDKYCSSSNSNSNSRSPSRSPCNYSYPRHSSSSSTAASRTGTRRPRWNKHYCNVVAEEELQGGGYYDDGGGYVDGDDGTCSRLWNCLVFGLGFGAVFAGLCLGLWIASGPYTPQLSIKRLSVENLFVGEGSDHTGVPTKLISINCSANLVIYNPATFFGIHITSQAANLMYSHLTVASGQVKKYYLPKKSKSFMWVPLIGRGVPLYGAGMALAATSDYEIPFKLEFEIHSIGYLVGKLVKTKHTLHVSCFLLINPNHTKLISFRVNACKYI